MNSQVWQTLGGALGQLDETQANFVSCELEEGGLYLNWLPPVAELYCEGLPLSEEDVLHLWGSLHVKGIQCLSVCMDGKPMRLLGESPKVWGCQGGAQAWAGKRYFSWSGEGLIDGWQLDDSLLLSALMPYLPGRTWLNLEPLDSLFSSAALSAGALHVVNVTGERWVQDHLRDVHRFLGYRADRLGLVDQPMASCWSRLPKQLDIDGAVVRCHEMHGDVQRQAALALRRLEPVLVPEGILALWGADESLPLPNLKRLLKREGPDFVYVDHVQQQGDFVLVLRYEP
ncbi:class I SAM-dependent methyltransferase [Pokkaliibacter sp. MBI-7]|uniref:class I SAM-dependent methyltransferase n=1 Tax=Pokkaliibacter sp. MBI-7 TaxID=3040600 RepID=UPI0024475F73|nr:class I SAM-dependent methyltransferase [Pokkaliibacter sp. MBI-7]MDH2436425.1 class I SAM-dependent methyltransferase [Pokkaliibacter sp. MBI-7]